MRIDPLSAPVSDSAESSPPEPKASPSPPAKPAFQEPLGVSIEFIRQFVRDHKKMENYKNFTTADVCAKIVLEETREQRQAYIDGWKDKADESGKPLVSKATVFVSHAWKYEFALLP